MNTLADRVRRLIAGTAHATIDKIENAAPELVMEQAIRDVEAAIADVRAELGAVIAERHMATKQLAHTNDKHAELAGHVETAVSVSRDDLAAAAIGRQLDLEAQIPVLERALVEAAEKERELEGFIGALQGKRAEMREDLKRYRQAVKERPENAIIDASGRPSGLNPINLSVDKATAAFERIAGGLSTVNGESLKTAAQMAELRDLSRKSEIDRRLLEYKAGSA